MKGCYPSENIKDKCGVTNKTELAPEVGKRKSYGQILKSSSLMGGAAGITIILGMIRTKFAAVWIGTLGVGVLANFMAIQGLIGAVFGMGLESSAVREIASHSASSDDQALAKSVKTLWRISALASGVGFFLTLLLSPYLSVWVFGNNFYQWHIVVLGLTIALRILYGRIWLFYKGFGRLPK